MEPKRPAVRSKSGSEKKAGPWRPTKRQVLWVIGMVVALLTTALLIVNLRPEIWKSLLEERNLTLIAIGVSLMAIIVLLAIGGAASSWTGFRGKTVWDLLQLLIVPLALAVIGLWFAAQQDARQQQIENQRAQAERELAAQRAQDEALQAYLDQMSGLLLERDLRASEEDSEVRTLARARTLTVLERLDPSRKTAVMQFLIEADLVQRADATDPIIGLSGADLREANLNDAALRAADLRHAHLRWANLSNAQLAVAHLRHANLYGADLSGAGLWEANLKHANLKHANLRHANLSGADLGGGLIEANGVTGVSFPAKLSGADLSGADLSGATKQFGDQAIITNEELEQQAKSLKGATMPNGQKYQE